MFPVSLFLLLLGIFLYMDRFLFKGALARLFIEGWGQILHRKKKCGPPAASASAAPASGEKLILCKEYIEGTERQQGEQTPENESTNEGNTTFTSATGASVQPEILEWCDPAYFSDIPSKKSSVSYMDADSKSLRWEDDDFAVSKRQNSRPVARSRRRAHTVTRRQRPSQPCDTSSGVSLSQ